ncbi:hypothetical protein F4778DRAFT_720822 [Xylariomycetidae sp. FL2044]|nr:hypothetical protein F4778DRAFT_720822 [Xylariomycetidae sp. FL2044]
MLSTLERLLFAVKILFILWVGYHNIPYFYHLILLPLLTAAYIYLSNLPAVLTGEWRAVRAWVSHILTTWFSSAKSSVANGFNAISNRTSDSVSSARSYVSKGVDTFANGTGSLVSSAKSYADKGVNAFANSTSSMKSTISDTFRNASIPFFSGNSSTTTEVGVSNNVTNATSVSIYTGNATVEQTGANVVARAKGYVRTGLGAIWRLIVAVWNWVFAGLKRNAAEQTEVAVVPETKGYVRTGLGAMWRFIVNIWDWVLFGLKRIAAAFSLAFLRKWYLSLIAKVKKAANSFLSPESAFDSSPGLSGPDAGSPIPGSLPALPNLPGPTGTSNGSTIGNVCDASDSVLCKVRKVFEALAGPKIASAASSAVNSTANVITSVITTVTVTVTGPTVTVTEPCPPTNGTAAELPFLVKSWAKLHVSLWKRFQRHIDAVVATLLGTTILGFVRSYPWLAVGFVAVDTIIYTFWVPETTLIALAFLWTAMVVTAVLAANNWRYLRIIVAFARAMLPQVVTRLG